MKFESWWASSSRPSAAIDGPEELARAAFDAGVASSTPVQQGAFDAREWAINALFVPGWDHHWIPEHYRDALKHAQEVIQEVYAAGQAAQPPVQQAGADLDEALFDLNSAHHILDGAGIECGPSSKEPRSVPYRVALALEELEQAGARLSVEQVKIVLFSDTQRRNTHTMERRIETVTEELNALLAAPSPAQPIGEQQIVWTGVDRACGHDLTVISCPKCGETFELAAEHREAPAEQAGRVDDEFKCWICSGPHIGSQCPRPTAGAEGEKS